METTTSAGAGIYKDLRIVYARLSDAFEKEAEFREANLGDNGLLLPEAENGFAQLKEWTKECSEHISRLERAWELAFKVEGRPSRAETQ